MIACQFWRQCALVLMLDSVLTACSVSTQLATQPTSLETAEALTMTRQPTEITPMLQPTPLEAAETPTLTEQPTQIVPTPQPTPDFLQLAIAQNVLFSPASDPTCHLPCWQNLRVGASTRADVQKMFDSVFEFHGLIDFFNTGPHFADAWIVKAPGIYTTGYEWSYGPEGISGFTILLAVDETTGVLQGIQFASVPAGMFTVHTPQQVIGELGQPDEIRIRIHYNAQSSDAVPAIRLVLIYRQGIGLSYIYIPERLSSEVGGFGDLCLNTAPEVVWYNILEPFDLEHISALQQEWVFDYIERFNIKPIQDYLGLSINEFSHIALSDNPCIALDYTAFSP